MVVNPRNTWPAVIVALGAMVVAAVMAIAHVPQDTIVTVTSSLGGVVIGALVVGPVATMAAGVQAVREQTNGQQTQQLAILERLANMLAAANVPPSALSAPTSSTVDAPPPASTVDTPPSGGTG